MSLVGGGTAFTSIDTSRVDLSRFPYATYALNDVPTPIGFRLTEYGAGVTVYTFQGRNLTYDSGRIASGGEVTSISLVYASVSYLSISQASLSMATIRQLAASADSVATAQYLMSGNDTITGPDASSRLFGYAGDDYIQGGSGRDVLDGGEGNDSVFGGAGSDTVTGGGGTNYLRGDDGDDSIVGGAGFDDINGNQGNDTCASGGGDDWVVGGKGNDSLTGSAGQNLVYGNIGADTCDGGGGDDIVRGGQDNDSVAGGGGNDYVSGDKGDDTMSGGGGADVFHSFGDAGLDRVLDFNLAEGDRVQLDPGTQYTVSQVGADTVIAMVGGAQMVLVGVSLSSLTGNWIFIG